jgi:hypothetical protein
VAPRIRITFLEKLAKGIAKAIVLHGEAFPQVPVSVPDSVT